MIAMSTPLLVVPILAAGYTLMLGAILAGATVLAWDALRLFADRSATEHIVHQRQYATSVGTAVTSLASLLFVVLILVLSAGAGLAAAAKFLL